MRLIKHGIRVNAVAPGVVDTPFWASVAVEFARYEGKEVGETKRAVAEAVPYGCMGKPEDHGGIAAFLASNESEYAVPQMIGVDGGNCVA